MYTLYKFHFLNGISEINQLFDDILIIWPAPVFQVFISFNFDDYNWQLMKTPNSVSQKIRILWKGSILKTPGATL